MNRTSVGKWARRAVWGALVAVAGIGCSPLNVIGFMFARDDKMPAPHPLTFAKDGPKKDKDEVVVVLLPQMASGFPAQFATADRDLADKLSRLLPELAKENKDKRKLRVISPTQVDKFKMSNPTWKQMSAAQIGQKLGADFVLEIWLDKMRLYQPNSANNIYEGKAEVQVQIYEIGADDGELKDKYDLPFAYPPNGGVRDASVMSEGKFKMLFMENLASEIARQHIDCKPSNAIADGK
jgi:hypothetical protein